MMCKSSIKGIIKKILLNVVFVAAGSHHWRLFGEGAGMLVRVGLLG